MITHSDVLALNDFLARMKGTYMKDDDPKVQEENRKRAEHIVELVQRYTKYSYALMRIDDKVDRIKECIDKALKNAKLEEYNKRAQELVTDRLKDYGLRLNDINKGGLGEPEKEEARKKLEVTFKKDLKTYEDAVKALNLEFDFENLAAAENARRAEFLSSEVLEDDGTPIKFYQIEASNLPGWNDPAEVPFEKRGGILSSNEMKFLMKIGILKD